MFSSQLLLWHFHHRFLLLPRDLPSCVLLPHPTTPCQRTCANVCVLLGGASWFLATAHYALNFSLISHRLAGIVPSDPIWKPRPIFAFKCNPNSEHKISLRGTRKVFNQVTNPPSTPLTGSQAPHTPFSGRNSDESHSLEFWGWPLCKKTSFWQNIETFSSTLPGLLCKGLPEDIKLKLQEEQESSEIDRTDNSAEILWFLWRESLNLDIQMEWTLQTIMLYVFQKSVLW